MPGFLLERKERQGLWRFHRHFIRKGKWDLGVLPDYGFLGIIMFSVPQDYDQD
jgi:hypothetical protein